MPNQDGSWTESVLYSFCSLTNCRDGADPAAGLIFDTAGNLYGTTAFGGATNSGTVFQLMFNQDGSWTESVLYNFCSLTNCADGSNPSAGLIFDAAGNLYGTAGTGGSGAGCHVNGGCGTTFELTASLDGSWTEKVLYNLCSLTNCVDGLYPAAGLIFDAAGAVYSTTSAGGIYGAGVIFKLTSTVDGGWKENVLHQFGGSRDGAGPLAGLIFDQAGNLYGTTLGGNKGGYGVVFKMVPEPGGRWTEKVLYRFTGGKDGSFPRAGLIFDTAGNLFSTTEEGGNLDDCNGVGCGVVFKLAPNSNGGWYETVLHRFADHPGYRAYAGLILNATGDLYGTTSGDTNKTHGSVFEITP
jgi:uncharacterized repeat protein (TIGR03803 family)